MVPLYTTPQHLQSYLEVTSGITTGKRKLFLFWRKISVWWGTVSDNLLRQAKKQQSILRSASPRCLYACLSRPHHSPKSGKENQKIAKMHSSISTWQSTAWHFRSGKEERLPDFVLSQHCSFSNLCSQAGSYTHSVQIHHLSSEAWALLEKRGNES